MARRPLPSLLSVRMALRMALAALLLLLGSWAQAAPSACTAMWGMNGTSLQYWNGTNWVVAAGNGLGTTANAMGGYAGTGSLYYVSQVASPTRMHRADFNNLTGTITFTTGSGIGLVVTPTTALSYTSTANVSTTFAPATLNFVGATFDRNTASRRMFVYATGAAGATNVPTTTGATDTVALIGLLDPEAPATVSWKVIYESQSAGSVTYPYLALSGDIFADQQTGDFWIVTNTNPNRMYKLALNYTGLTLNSAQVVGTATLSGFSGLQAGIASDPLTGAVYVSSGAGGTTTLLVDHTANPVVGSTAVTGTGVGDSGNCVEKPDPPSVTKSISPGGTTATVGTATLTITIINPNKVPLFLKQALTDTFPANMSVYTTPGLNASCASDGAAATRPTSATMTAVVGATSAVIAAGTMIPGGTSSGGSCSFSVVISATVANLYSNTIPAGSLTTTAGTNTSAVTATYQLRATDFSIVKTQQVGSATASLASTSITVAAGRTFTYQLTVVNSTGGVTATATFTDTMPTLLTPVLTITATPSGGGACAFATATVAGARQITGTRTTAPPGSTCVLLIQGLTSSTVALATTTVNTGTITPTAAFDSNSANNSSSVTITVAPTAFLTITKTNNVSTVTSGSTTNYTITLVNLGPAAATATTVVDGTVTGLSCTNVSCVASGTAVCPGSPTIGGLQTAPGLTIPTFPANSTVSFVVNCSVTATGF